MLQPRSTWRRPCHAQQRILAPSSLEDSARGVARRRSEATRGGPRHARRNTLRDLSKGGGDCRLAHAMTSARPTPSASTPCEALGAILRATASLLPPPRTASVHGDRQRDR